MQCIKYPHSTSHIRQGSRSNPGFADIWCEKKEVGQNIECDMFSRLKFSVDFNSEVRNAKFWTWKFSPLTCTGQWGSKMW